MSAPAPFAHQWFGLIPLPMKSAAKRSGSACGAGRFAPPHRERFEPGQGHRNAGAAEHGASVDSRVLSVMFGSLGFVFANGTV